MEKGVYVIGVLLFIISLVGGISAEEEVDYGDMKTWTNNPDEIFDNWYLNEFIEPKRTWDLADPKDKIEFWKGLNDYQQKTLWEGVLDINERVLFLQQIGDNDPAEQVKLWKNSVAAVKSQVWGYLDRYGISGFDAIKVRNTLWKNLGTSEDGKKERNKLWFAKDDTGAFRMSDESRGELFGICDTREKQRDMIEHLINSDYNRDVLKRRGIEAKHVKVEFGNIDVDYFNLMFRGNKLVSRNGEDYSDGAYLRVDRPSEWMESVKFEDNGKITFGVRDSDRELELDIGTVDSFGKFELLGITDKVFEFGKEISVLNVLEGNEGNILINKEGLVSLTHGAKAKLGDSVLRQFYSAGGKVSKWYNADDYIKSYNAEHPDSKITDEAAVLDFLGLGGEVSESPSDKRPISRVKNTIMEVREGNKVLGDAYFSRRQLIDFYQNDNRFDPAYDSGFSIASDEKGKIRVAMIANNYVGFIARKGVDVTNLVMNGEGGKHKGVGKYLYFRNGDFGITVNKDKTFYSGRIGRVVVSVNDLRNTRKRDVYGIEKDSSGGRLYAYRGKSKVPITTVNSKIWKESRLLGIDQQVAKTKQKVMQQTAKRQASQKKSVWGRQTSSRSSRSSGRSFCSGGQCSW